MAMVVVVLATTVIKDVEGEKEKEVEIHERKTLGWPL